VRAGGGLLVSSYKINQGAAVREPVGENEAGVGLVRQAVKMAGVFHQAAITHQTVGLAVHVGAGKASSSVLDESKAPLEAMVDVFIGGTKSESANAAVESVGGAASETPSQMTDPLISVAAMDGLGVSALQSLQLTSGETTSLMSAGSTQIISGGVGRIQSHQSIGLLAGAIKAVDDKLGLQVVAAKDAIDVQAQSDEVRIQARDEVNVLSANAQIDWAAVKNISLSTSGGAKISIDGGNITVVCPGTLKIYAGKKSLCGPENAKFDFPVMPSSATQYDERFELLNEAGEPVRNIRYRIEKSDGGYIEGVTDDQGRLIVQQGFSPDKVLITILGRAEK